MIEAAGMREFAKILLFRRRWKKNNSHNGTYPETLFDGDLVEVGRGTYGPIKLIATGAQAKLRIGSWCSIARGVTFVMNNEHPLNHMSTFPFTTLVYSEKKLEVKSKGGITIGDDVWLGCNALILDGVKIGQGAVVGAGSVVTRDVPPYAIVCGTPARVLKYRFDEKTIAQLIKFDWSSIDEEDAVLCRAMLYADYQDENDLNRWNGTLRQDR